MTTARPGHINGSTMLRSPCIADAPSVHAASSSSIGTPSMKFLDSQMEIGSAVVAMNRIVPVSVSIRLTCTNSP